MTKNKTCQYIGSTGIHTGACGCAVVSANSSYCETHHAAVYQVGSGRATRHKDIRTANSVWDLQSTLNEAIAELEAEGFL
jgi:hypothetical protein